MTDKNDKDRKSAGGWRLVTGPIPGLSDGTVIGDGGWVMPRPATREDVLAAVQGVIAEVRQDVQELRAQCVARASAPEPSPTHVVVGDGAGQPAMLDVKTCAALLRISVRSWQRLVERRQAPQPVKIGKLSRWRRSDVEAFIASRR